jgi:hypothetical protein
MSMSPKSLNINIFQYPTDPKLGLRFPLSDCFLPARIPSICQLPLNRLSVLLDRRNMSSPRNRPGPLSWCGSRYRSEEKPLYETLSRGWDNEHPDPFWDIGGELTGTVVEFYIEICASSAVC